MFNVPDIKIGIVAVSRDCFPKSLSETRRKSVVAASKDLGIEIFEAPTIVENELDMLKSLEEVNKAECNALVVYLGNFGPETAETLLAQKFDGPTMFVAAGEEDCGKELGDNRGDAYCGMLNASYNLALRGIKAFIPEYPVGVPSEVANMIAEFVPVARAIVGVRNLRIISFGPRPQDFLACNAPIKRLYELGVEIEENSELDLFAAYNAHKDDPRIPEIVADMAKELGAGNKMSGVLPRLAQFEATLVDWYEQHRGSKKFAVFANKCWPSFQTQFGFVPCYVNSRLATRGIPVACEVDIFGALSEYVGSCVTQQPVTLLDINNTVPINIYNEGIGGKYSYGSNEVFMGFHCGNTPSCKLVHPTMKYQKIMHRSLEPDKEPDITRGTLEGDIAPGAITFFRLQSTADTKLRGYIAEGEVLPVGTRSFGSIGIFAINEMNRFYRHVLIEDNYPHHGAVAFGKVGKSIFSVMKYLGIEKVNYNQPKGVLYPSENPFA
jgi:L-fucose isomerase-like protein